GRRIGGGPSAYDDGADGLASAMAAARESKTGTVAARSTISTSRLGSVPGAAASATTRPDGVAAWKRAPTTLLSTNVASDRSTTTFALFALTASSSAWKAGTVDTSCSPHNATTATSGRCSTTIWPISGTAPPADNTIVGRDGSSGEAPIPFESWVYFRREVSALAQSARIRVRVTPRSPRPFFQLISAPPSGSGE